MGDKTLGSGGWLPMPLGHPPLGAGGRQSCSSSTELWQSAEEAGGSGREETAIRSTSSSWHAGRKGRLEAGSAAYPMPRVRQEGGAGEKVPHWA